MPRLNQQHQRRDCGGGKRRVKTVKNCKTCQKWSKRNVKDEGQRGGTKRRVTEDGPKMRVTEDVQKRAKGGGSKRRVKEEGQR